MENEYIICKWCDKKCDKRNWLIFGCPHCQRREYEEIMQNKMDIDTDYEKFTRKPE